MTRFSELLLGTWHLYLKLKNSLAIYIVTLLFSRGIFEPSGDFYIVYIKKHYLNIPLHLVVSLYKLYYCFRIIPIPYSYTQRNGIMPVKYSVNPIFRLPILLSFTYSIVARKTAK